MPLLHLTIEYDEALGFSEATKCSVDQVTEHCGIGDFPAHFIHPACDSPLVAEIRMENGSPKFIFIREATSKEKEIEYGDPEFTIA